MLKQKALKRIFITSVAVLIVLSIYSFFKLDDYTNIYGDSYFIEEKDTENIYCLNTDQMVSKTSIYVDQKLSLEEKIQTLLEAMIENNNKNSLLPSYYEPMIPKNTKVLEVKVDKDIVKITFSKEFLEGKKEQNEKMMEAIVYTCSEFDEILGIQIYVENDILRYIPKTNQKLPAVLTRDFGINKVYEVSNNKEIHKVILYYLGSELESDVYVPVTKYLNDSRDKIEIIVEELKNRFLYSSSLRSFLNAHATLKSYEEKNGELVLSFSNGIYDDPTLKKFKEEGMIALCYSVFDNYPEIDTVKVFALDEKIYEKTRKDLEK